MNFCLRRNWRLAIVIGAFLWTAAPGSAADDLSLEPIPAPWKATASLEFLSTYIFRGEKLGGFSAEPSIETSGRSLTLGIWSNLPWAHLGEGTGNSEVDAYGYYNARLSSILAILPGFTLYNYPAAITARGNFRHALEPNVAANFVADGFRFTPEVYYDFQRHARTIEIATAYAYALPALGTELDLNALLGATDVGRAAREAGGDFLERSRDYAAAGAAFPYQFGRWRATVGFQYAFGFAGDEHASGGTMRSDPLVTSRGIMNLTVGYQW